MPFSNFQLLHLTMQLLLFSQGCPHCLRQRYLGLVNVSCCTKVGNGVIKHSVDGCFEQKETTFPHCRVHALIFTKGDKTWCVDPEARWVPQRLRRLQKRGICCQII